MTALPIVSRELRILARRPSTYWLRFGIALLAVVVGGYMLSFTSSLNMGAMAKQIVFSMISSIVGIYALFSGIRNTADCLSVEKREGTLGLLFLTDLKGYDVVLGKLSSAAIHSLYGMIAAFPVFGVALIGGGITGSEFLRASLAIVNVIFFAHAAGLAVSAYSLNARRAAGTGLFIGFLMIWGLPAATAFLTFAGWHQTGQWLGQLSPVNALHLALSSMPVSPGSVMFGGGLPGIMRASFWSALTVSNLLGWIFILIASWHAPRSWQNVDIKLNWRARMRHVWYGSAEARNAFRRKLVGINPFFWLASRARFDPHTTWLSLLAVAGVILWIFYKVGIKDVTALAITLTVALHLVVRIGIASSASRHFAEQRKSGALEFLLACTPLDTKDLVSGQWRALRRQFFAPLIAILLMDAVFAILIGIWGSPNETPKYFLFGTAMAVMLIADSIALGWVGMWTGISSNKTNRAAGAAVGRVMVWPCIGAFFLWSRIGVGTGAYVLLGVWFVIGLICDAFLVVHARNNLYAKFRTLAATPYEEQSGIMAAVGRIFGQATRSRARTSEIPPMIAK